jgi:hypothetical protein
LGFWQVTVHQVMHRKRLEACVGSHGAESGMQALVPELDAALVDELDALVEELDALVDEDALVELDALVDDEDALVELDALVDDEDALVEELDEEVVVDPLDEVDDIVPLDDDTSPLDEVDVSPDDPFDELLVVTGAPPMPSPPMPSPPVPGPIMPPCAQLAATIDPRAKIRAEVKRFIARRIVSGIAEKRKAIPDPPITSPP